MPATKSAVLFIEFQKEWLDPEVGLLNGLMTDRAQLDASIAGGRRALELARERSDLEAVHVPCLFRPGYPEAGVHRHGLFAAIPRAGTWTGPGRPFAEGFEPADGEYVVNGRVGASAFSHSDLDIYLRQQGITQLYLTGYALHVCVESTLRQAHDLGYDVTVLSDACSAFTAEQRDHVLGEVVHHFGAHATVDAAFADGSATAAA